MFGSVRRARLQPGVAVAVTALTTALVTVVGGCSKPQGTDPVTPAHPAITSTTQIAGAGVLGNLRRPDESCAAEPARTDAGDAPRRVASGTDRGDIDVVADPQRIVVLAAGQLDALCALGLQGRVVAAALPDGSDQQPSYLGTVIHDLHSAGSEQAPDLTAIAAAKPDLILGSGASTPQAYGQLSAIAPTVFAGAPGAGWQDTLRSVGSATNRTGAVDGLLTEFTDAAKQAGAKNDAAHFQASVVQLTDNSVRVFGTANFPGSVLTAVGVERPAAQRFTDKPYVEIGAADVELAHADFAAADGDIVYLSFASASAKERAHAVLESPAWRRLSATRDNRVFIVNNEIWQNGQGLVAARGIIDDLRWLNAPIN